MSDPQPSFDDLIGQLESRVRRLESGELPLEAALELFEEGIELTRACHECLDDAGRRLLELSDDGRGPRSPG